MDFDYSRIDGMAIAGYRYAAGDGKVPKLLDQLDIDAFNAGISNYNIRNSKAVPPLFERTFRDFDSGVAGTTADKELAIVGASHSCI